MTDGFPDRITQLRARWQADPSSRVFLQLAEEYRHIGRVQDALAVLESGLKEHPGYLSALVAQGRCLLELGDAGKARGVLERVVQQDATQMVASKLLVRAYIETNDPERARQRLDLYRLLNDSDPEIEELHRRVVAMGRPPQAPDEPRPEEPAERPRMDSTETPAAEVFDLGPAEPAHSLAAEEDLFGLGNLPATLPEAPHAALPAPPAAAAAAMEPTAEMPGTPVTALAPTAPAAGTAGAAVVAEMPGTPVAATTPRPSGFASYGGKNGSDPFPDPAPEESRRRYLAGFAAEGIFSFLGGVGEQEPGPRAEIAAAEPEAEAGGEPGAGAALAAPASPVEAPSASPASPAAAGSRATLTLGELYLRQGHFEEAERIFGEVAQRDPGNAAAREALAALPDIARRASGQAQPVVAATQPAAPSVAEVAAGVAATAAVAAAAIPRLPPAAAQPPAAGGEPEPVVRPESPAMASAPPAPTEAEPPATTARQASPAPVEPEATAAEPASSTLAAAAAAANQPQSMPPAATARPAGGPGTAGGPWPRPLDAGQLLAGMPDPQAAPTARKAYLLQSYLTRLRQPRSPHVP